MSGKKTVLIVDDQPENIRLTRKMLQGDFELLEAGDGEKALKLLEEKAVDLILSDIQMPEIDGPILSMLIRMDDRFEKIRMARRTAPGNARHQQERSGIR